MVLFFAVCAALAGQPDDVVQDVVDDGGPKARHVPAVPFSRHGRTRELSCAGDTCVMRGGVGDSVPRWLARGGEVKGTHRSERWLAFARSYMRDDGMAGYEDVGVVELATGIATWSRERWTDGPGMAVAQVTFEFDKARDLLWVKRHTHVPQMQAFDATVHRLPTMHKVRVQGDVVAASVHEPTSELVSAFAVPDVHSEWKPTAASEVLAFAHSQGGCRGPYGVRPIGCSLQVRWAIDQTPAKATAWRVAFCYSEDHTLPQRGWQTVSDGDFVRSGDRPGMWRWGGLPLGETPCQSTRRR